MNSQEWTLSRSVPELKVVSASVSTGQRGVRFRDSWVTCEDTQARTPWDLLVPGAQTWRLRPGESLDGTGVAGRLGLVARVCVGRSR